MVPGGTDEGPPPYDGLVSQPPENPFGIPGDAFNDVPLFREIQRVLAASAGPINWELARQVGIATAVSGHGDPPTTEDDRREMEEAVRVADLQVAGFTGLDAPSELATVRAVRRAEWVQTSVEGLRELLEPHAARVSEAMEQLQRETAGADDAAESAMTPVPMLSQLSPLLLGAQVGAVLGTLGQRVLGQFDIAVPRSGHGQLLFVIPNIAAFEHDWSLPRTEFRTWVAFHEVTHGFEFARPWVPGHLRMLLTDFLSTLRIDAAELRNRMEGLDLSNPESLQEALGSEEVLFGALLDPEQRIKLSRIQAFMAAAEGYGDHVMHSLGATLLPSYAQIEEAMLRYREGERGDPVFERLLGIEMKREQYDLGRRFCDEVARQTDEQVLARMWDSADSLPSMPELEEPMLWLARWA
jgi:putative hydrolase